VIVPGFLPQREARQRANGRVGVSLGDLHQGGGALGAARQVKPSEPKLVVIGGPMPFARGVKGPSGSSGTPRATVSSSPAGFNQ
jgi:hypothetical protein